VERNRKADQNPPRVVAPTEEEEEVFRHKSLFIVIGHLIAK
jgi:hypothetical protein